jgi:hypothetical protein
VINTRTGAFGWVGSVGSELDKIFDSRGQAGDGGGSFLCNNDGILCVDEGGLRSAIVKFAGNAGFFPEIQAYA